MSAIERWWVCEFYNGNLKRKMDAADAKCYAVQAKPFSIGHED